MSVNIKYFDTFEEREAEFRKSVHNLVPRKNSSTGAFWKVVELSNIVEKMSQVNLPIGYITPNPIDCFAFSTPLQNLQATSLVAKKYKNTDFKILAEAIELFKLKNILNQPLRTLSGGESVELALSKSYIMGEFCENLTICSPFSWLSSQNRYLLDIVKQKYQNKKKEIVILAMHGEDSDDSISDSLKESISEIFEFSLVLKDVNVNLKSTLDATDEDYRNFQFNSITMNLFSPCILTGDNGEGKSLISYLLSRAINFSGDAYIINAGKKGSARLVFQDIFTQTMYRSFKGIADKSSSKFGFDVYEVYNEILQQFRAYYANLGEQIPFIGSDEDGNELSLLQIKAIIAAARLTKRTAALILDEPDWGLSKSSAIALVLSIINVSHKYGIPVIIISHKSWWRGIKRSTVSVKKYVLDDNHFKIEVNSGEIDDNEYKK